MFDRADVIVAVAPHLHGLPLSELDRVVDAVIADVRCVPLIGVAGSRTQAYATAATLAAEERIAALAETLATRPAPLVAREAARVAVERTERQLGRLMTAGQRRAAEGLLTSAAGLEVVVGIAGSGKTTMLAAVRAGFTAYGFSVIGTATSGQAARGLGDGAGQKESRTIASLCWRLDHDRIRLGPGHVVLLDEAGMTDDPDLGRLLVAVERAGAKLIVVGDDRQLSPVGPGGCLGALARRHPNRVWTLAANVRQADPAERDALAELRARQVENAVAFYAGAGRVIAAPCRDDAIVEMVTAWSADVRAGRQSLLLAWRRADVGDLNGQARAAYAALGRLAGPVAASGGRRYQARRQPCARLHQRHRHVLEDGGGRELAYVAMSRARRSSHVYVPALTTDDAVEHLRWAWTSQRRQSWAHDQGQPQPRPATLIAERDRLVRHVSLQAGLAAGAANQQLRALDHDIADLHAGAGRWAHTPAGAAARALRAAESRLWTAQRQATDPQAGFIGRRRAARAIPELRDELKQAQRRWQADAQPVADHLAAQRDNLLDQARGPAQDKHNWLVEHPHIAEHLDHLNQQIAARQADGRPAQQTRPFETSHIDIGL